MDIVRKNALSIVCGVVALVAVASLFFPISGMYAGLGERVTASAAAYPTLTGLRDKPRTKPIIDPSKAEAEELEFFPTQTVIQQGQAMIDRRAEVAKTILGLARQRNVQAPLVEGALPAPDPRGRAGFNFRERYRDVTNADGDTAAQSIPRQVLAATTPPTPEEVQAAVDRTAQQIGQAELRFVGGQATNADDVAAKIRTEIEDLPERLRQQRAQQNRMYVEPTAFPPHPAIAGGGNAPDATSIFNAQTMYWAQLEAAKALANANAGAQSVIDAPVKHLLSLGVPEDFPGVGTAAAIALADGSVPAELAVSASTEIPPKYDASPTGRPTHAPLYDVVRFPMVIRVEASRVPEVLAALQADRLLTITSADAIAFDSAAALAAGYVYGEEPIVELRLQCELMWLREWLVPLMPAAVKQAIVAAEAAAAAAATPGV